MLTKYKVLSLKENQQPFSIRSIMSNSTLIYTLMGVIVPVAIKSLLQSSSDLISCDPKIGIDLPTDPTASKSELTVTSPLYSLFFPIFVSSIDNIKKLLLLALIFSPTTSAIQAEPYRADGLDHTHDLDYKMILKAIQRGNLKQVQKSITNGFPVDYHKAGTSTVLMLAAQQGHVNVVKLLISEGASLNLKIGNGHTALKLAAQQGHVNVVELLLGAEASLDLKDDNGRTALMMAAQQGHVNVVELLLGAEASLDLKDDNGRTALMMVAHHGHKEIVKQLIAAGANLDLKERFGITALITAAGQGHVNVVKQLIAAGASLDLQQDDGGTALMMAAQKNHEEIVKQLIAAGASLDLQQDDSGTALMMAAQKNHEEIVKQLITAGAKVPVVSTEYFLINSITSRLLYEYLNIKGTNKIMYGIKNNNIYFIQKALGLKPRNKLKVEHLFAAIESGHVNVVRYILNQKEGLKNAQGFSGTTPLIYAAGHGHVNVVKLLIAAKAFLNLRQDDGRTALILAAYHGHVNIVELLIAAKAFLNLQEDDGITALITAAYQGHVNVVKQLITAGASLDLQQDDRRTALIRAAGQGHVNVVKQLITAGASLDLQQNDGRTALMWAAHQGHVNVVELLIAEEASLDLHEVGGETALMMAAHQGHVNVVELLIAEEASLDLHEVGGETALMMAAQKNHEEIVKQLISKGASLDLYEFGGETALMMAAHQGHVNVVKLLIAAGASLDLKSGNGHTALMFAAQHNHGKIVKQLIDAGANPNLENKHGKTAREISSISAEDYKKKVLLELLKKEPEKCIPFIEQFNIDTEETLFDQSLLYWATQANHYDLIAYLIDKGADLDQVIASVNEQDEIDIETENKLQTIKKYGISGLRLLNFLNTSRTQIPRPEEALLMKIQTELLLDELSKQATPILEDLSTELCSFVSLITDPRVMAMLVTTVVIITSAFWYLYSQKSLAMEKKVSDAEQRASLAEESTNKQNDKISNLKMQIERRGAHAKLQKEKIIAAEQKLIELSEKLKETTTQLTEQISVLEGEKVDLKASLETLQTKLLGFENIQKDIDLIRKTSDQKKTEELTRFYNELDSLFRTLCCPISCTLMKDPVLATDGYIYEREIFTQWVTENQGASVFGGDPIDMTNLQSQESYYDEKTEEIKQIIEQIKLLIQPDKKLEADLERLNPIHGYEEVLVSYKGMLESCNISVDQQLKVFYGLAFIATQAAERSKVSLAEQGAVYEAARHARNFIQHPPSFKSTTCNKTLKNIIIALEELSSSTDPQSIFESIHRDFELLLTQTQQLKKDELKEIIKHAKKLCPDVAKVVGSAGTSATDGGGAAKAGGAEYHISGSPDSVTHTSISVALQGVYIQICNLIAFPALKGDKLAKEIKKLTIFERALRNASAHGEQPLTDEEIEIFCKAMNSFSYVKISK